MRGRPRLAAPMLALALALPMTAHGDEAPRLLHAHPDQDLHADAGPFWVAASWVFKSDGTVREADRIGVERASSIASDIARKIAANARADEDEGDPDCHVTPEKAAGRRALISMPGRVVFLPGDFTGWVAASRAVVLGTVTELVPGFDATGRPNTLVVLGDIDHFFPSGSYPYIVEYVILPYAQFAAGGVAFCYPWLVSQEYYPSIGDRVLIAADSPADNKGLAMTVRAMSRVVQVQGDDTLVTYGRSDFYPVAFASDFPETLEEAKTQAWEIWRNGLVDFADSLGMEEFTQAWRRLSRERSALESRGCDVDLGSFHSDATGWTFSARCPGPEERPADTEVQEPSR